MSLLKPDVVKPPLRTVGRGMYIWKQGVLGFGVPAALAKTVWDYVRDHGWTLGGLASSGTLADLALNLAFLGIAGGYVFGELRWHLSERNHNREP